jgi:nucleoid-associated protein YgaU
VLALIFSIALNIGLIASLAFSALQKGRIVKTFLLPEAQTKVEWTNQGLLRQMASLSFRELVSQLTNRELIEDGFTKRDLALAALVKYHHFYLDKPLAKASLQRRLYQLEGDASIELFLGVTEEQYAAIVRFAYEEKWPLTTAGLFPLLQQSVEPWDASLVQALTLTPEFRAIQTLFQKSGAPQETEMLVRLCLEGDLLTLVNEAKLVTEKLDFSADRRQQCLAQYLQLHSKTAARLMLLTDPQFVARRLSDPVLIELITELGRSFAGAELNQLCRDVLASARSDQVWEAAARSLYAAVDEAPPVPFEITKAKARFSLVPALVATPTPVKELLHPASVRQYVVKDGDSLWKIARVHKVKVDEIVKLNRIDKDRLVPGMVLQIPE